MIVEADIQGAYWDGMDAHPAQELVSEEQAAYQGPSTVLQEDPPEVLVQTCLRDSLWVIYESDS
ncbi:MAG: hypothetical protein P1V81_00245 [Planctomycetota bacterium]|nr:hypothetical protein [Planctomycetota bacterium]